MSDHIGHIGICDDTFRLAGLHPEIQPEFKRWMQTHRDDSHLGAITRQADKWSADVIDSSRTLLEQNPGDSLALRKLCFVLGSLTHRAADRLTKPITRLADREENWDNNISKIMQDLLVYREVFAGGKGALATPFTPDCIGGWGDEGQTRFENMYRLLFRRALIGMHTFNPDSQNIDSWFESFFNGLQTFPKDLELYAHLAHTWPQDKVNRYLVEKNFYNREDEIIRVTRRIQQGLAVSPGEIVAAKRRTVQSSSRYARALAKALDYVLAAGELFRREISVEEAKIRFDVGVPEMSMME